MTVSAAPAERGAVDRRFILVLLGMAGTACWGGAALAKLIEWLDPVRGQPPLAPTAIPSETATLTAVKIETSTATGTATKAAIETEVSAWPLSGREDITGGFPVSRFDGFHSDIQTGKPAPAEMAKWTANIGVLESNGQLREKDVVTYNALRALYHGEASLINWSEGAIAAPEILADGRLAILADVQKMPPVLHEQVEEIVAGKLGISDFDAVAHPETERIFWGLLGPYGFFKIGTIFPKWGLDACQVVMDQPAAGEPNERNSQDPMIVRARWDDKTELGAEWIEDGVPAACPPAAGKDRLSHEAALGAMIDIVEDPNEADAICAKLIELQEEMGLPTGELLIAQATRGVKGKGYIFLSLIDFESQGPLWPGEQNPDRDGSFNLIIPCGCAPPPQQPAPAGRETTRPPSATTPPAGATPRPTETPRPSETWAPAPTSTAKPTGTETPPAPPLPTQTPRPTATEFPTATVQKPTDAPTMTPAPTAAGTPTPPPPPTERPTWTPIPTAPATLTPHPEPSPTPWPTPGALFNLIEFWLGI